MRKKISLKVLIPKKLLTTKRFGRLQDLLLRFSENITLGKGDDTITDNAKVADIFNDFFSNVVKNLKITINENIISDTNGIDDPVLKAIEKYKKHPSILAIKKISKNIFSFQKVSYEDIIKETQNLDASKACQDTDVPTKIIKNNSDIFGDFTYQNFNHAVDTDIFPNVLKNANVSPVFKKESRTCETNYRPVSILPNISKIYERCMYKQMSIFFDEILSQYQCGFRKGFSSQYCLAPMLEKWRESIDNGGCFGALLTDLSKAFDCLLHDLLIAKLHAYGFDMKALKFLHSYLSDQKQRVKINNEYSSFEEIVFGVPQGSILGPLLSIYS